MFDDFDFTSFWEESDYAQKEYVDDPLTDEKVAHCESVLGVTLPASMIVFMRIQNGGVPMKTNHRTSERTSWADDHIAISGIYSIGSAKPCSLTGEFKSEFWCNEWGYPPIGVYFADCPSGGHDMLCLDYRSCGSTGEPSVVHVDQGLDYKITFVAKNFASFVRGLESDDAFDVG